jgi:hypothetical protein
VDARDFFDEIDLARHVAAAEVRHVDSKRAVLRLHFEAEALEDLRRFVGLDALADERLDPLALDRQGGSRSRW